MPISAGCGWPRGGSSLNTSRAPLRPPSGASFRVPDKIVGTRTIGSITLADDKKRGNFTYSAAGVDIDAASTALDRVRQKIQATFAGTGAARPIGHFGGFYRL